MSVVEHTLKLIAIGCFAAVFGGWGAGARTALVSPALDVAMTTPTTPRTSTHAGERQVGAKSRDGVSRLVRMAPPGKVPRSVLALEDAAHRIIERVRVGVRRSRNRKTTSRDKPNIAHDQIGDSVGGQQEDWWTPVAMVFRFCELPSITEQVVTNV